MQRWLGIIQNTFQTFSKEKINKTLLDFNILEKLDKSKITIDMQAENGICFTVKEKLENSMDKKEYGLNTVAVIEVEPCKRDELQDKLEVIFDNLFGESSSELFVARNVIIDNLFGLEVLGGNYINENEFDVFYGLYLTCDKKAYLIIGISNEEPEYALESFTSISRLFL